MLKYKSNLLVISSMYCYQIILIAAFILLVSCAQQKHCSPDNLGCVLKVFEKDEFGDLHAVMVMQNGNLIFEQYYNDSQASDQIDVRSAGKSVTALLMGVAVDKKFINNLDHTVSTYWSEAKGTAVGEVGLKNLLTMRSGLDADANNEASYGYEDNMDQSDDPMAFALTVPNKTKPGTLYSYNSLAAYISGIVIGRATKKEFGEFAVAYPFKPLNIEKSLNWQKDSSGITKGQGNLFITARAFTRLGQLVLDRGMYNGEKIISRKWFDTMLAPHVDISHSDSNADAYGYYWYQRFYPINKQKVEVWFASGNGGNKIYIAPELSLVVTVMSDAYGQGRSHRRSEKILLEILKIKI